MTVEHDSHDNDHNSDHHHDGAIGLSPSSVGESPSSPAIVASSVKLPDGSPSPVVEHHHRQQGRNPSLSHLRQVHAPSSVNKSRCAKSSRWITIISRAAILTKSSDAPSSVKLADFRQAQLI